MQEFKTKFTTDISQHQRTMSAFRTQTCTAIQEARNQLVMLGGVSLGGLKIKDVTLDIIRLGAEMQQTRTAFEVMMGGVAKGNAVLDQLVRFADLTPFDNAAVIASGRALLNVNVTTGQLNGKLTMLGDIAAGAQQPLTDMVMIYAKAANKGKVQAEELNQLAERGVPILDALSKITGKSTAEIMKLGEQGKLSFELLDEAMQSLTASGGRYHGLMEKQSKNLAGMWAGVEAEIIKAGTGIGERAIPEIAAAVDEFYYKLKEMQESGELEDIMAGGAEAIGAAATALKDFVMFLVENRETLKSFGITAAGLLIIAKMKAAAVGAGRIIVGAVAASSATIDSHTIKTQMLAVAAEEKKLAAAAFAAKAQEALVAKRAMLEAQSYAATTAAAIASARARLAAEQALSGGKSAAYTDAAAALAQTEKSGQLADAAVQRTTHAYTALRDQTREAYAAIPKAPPAGLAAMKNTVVAAGRAVGKFGSGMAGVIAHPFAAAKMAAQNFGAAATAAFVGWELGKRIGEMAGLEEKFTRLIMKAKGMSDAEIDSELNRSATAGKTTAPTVAGRDLAADRDRLKKLRDDSAKLRTQIDDLDKARPERKREDQVAALEQENRGLDAAWKKRKELLAKAADLRRQAAAADRIGERAPAQAARKKAAELIAQSTDPKLSAKERGGLLKEADRLRQYAGKIESAGGSDKGDALRKEVAEIEKEAAALGKVKNVEKRRREIQDEITRLKQTPLDKSDPANAKAAATLKAELAEKEKEAAELEAAGQKYEAEVQKELATQQEINSKLKNANKAVTKLTLERDKLRQEDPYRSASKVYQHEEVDKELTAAIKARDALQTQFDAISATKREYQVQKNRLNETEVSDERAAASKLSAAAKLRLEEERENAKKRLEVARKVAEERKKLKKAQQQLADDRFRDAMSDKIDAWRENIKGYQKQIDETEKKLSKLGLSVDEDILKTPEQILQARKDQMLQTKIDAHNRGANVTFTDAEKKRIQELQDAQKKARAAKAAAKADEKNIEGAGKKVSALDKKRRDEDRAERAVELENREKALSAAEVQLAAAEKANAPVVKILETVADILKKGLPTETT